ncbi:MAG: hypothetical protein ACKO34_08320, partial [Vampirovibrionales bacterium]
LKTDFARSVETSAGLADNLGESYTLTDDVAFFTSTLDELKELTLADVQTALATYLKPELAYTAVLRPYND